MADRNLRLKEVISDLPPRPARVTHKHLHTMSIQYTIVSSERYSMVLYSGLWESLAYFDNYGIFGGSHVGTDSQKIVIRAKFPVMQEK